MKRLEQLKTIEAFRAYEVCTHSHLHMFVVNDYYDLGEKEIVRLFAVAQFTPIASELGLHLANDLVFRDEYGEELEVMSNLVNALEIKAQENLNSIQDSYLREEPRLDSVSNSE